MDAFDVGPYSPEKDGLLEKYLQSHPGGHTDNIFSGPKYFLIIRDNGWMIPNFTYVRVNRSPIPDLCYLVNQDFMLQSHGEGSYNMSMVGAKKGIYDPKEALKNATWSIFHLNLPKEE